MLFGAGAELREAEAVRSARQHVNKSKAPDAKRRRLTSKQPAPSSGLPGGDPSERQEASGAVTVGSASASQKGHSSHDSTNPPPPAPPPGRSTSGGDAFMTLGPNGTATAGGAGSSQSASSSHSHAASLPPAPPEGGSASSVEGASTGLGASSSSGRNAAFAAGMRCARCDRFGCSPELPACFFYGRLRDTHPDAGWGDNVPHLTQIEWSLERDLIVMHGKRFRQGFADGQGCNCLIDTLRSKLCLDVSLAAVRAELMKLFPFPGSRAHVTAGNYLTLADHWMTVVDLLFKYDQSGQPKLTHEQLKIVCVDLAYLDNGEVVGTGGTTLHIARIGTNHFIPLHQCF